MPPSRRFQNGVCKAILFTSLVWLLLDVFILFYYLENSLFNYESSNKKRHGASMEHYEEISSNVHTQLRSLLEGLNFDPNGPGANGAGLTIDKANDAEMRQKFKQNQFNIMASDSISVNRTLSDYRTEKCKSVVINEEKLPTVSIIIVFHNEAWSTLLRTLHSVVNRSPLRLITEIILIDDCSNRDYLKEPLQLYCKRFLLPVHLIHLSERSGLIRARLAGSAMAKGKVLLFLDAHVEVTEGWLPPLLDRISLNNRRVVAPIIDVISDETFEYVTASDTTWGGFNWHLNFRWYPVPDREMTRRNWDRSLPIETPTIAGGLFAISKKYFYEIGSYDDGMQVWGGENLEISFRVWTCGGTLEIHPCSRVGHVFRKQTPYTFPGGTAKVIHHNARRTAEVWMDDYKQFFYSMVPTARYVEVGDITKRLALRKRLHCKPFSWYLEKIYTESPIPAHYHSIGQIMNDQTRICIDTMGKKSGQLAGMSACHGLGGNQAWCLTVNGEIRSDELCLSVKSQSVFLEKCASAKPNAKHIFAHDFEKKIIVHKKSNNCLTASTSDGTLSIKPCVQNLPASRWIVENFTENPK